MADLVDIANEVVQRNIDDRLAAMKSEAANPTDDCVDCGLLIDPLRKAAVPGACRCALCQTDFEREKSLRGRR